MFLGETVTKARASKKFDLVPNVSVPPILGSVSVPIPALWRGIGYPLLEFCSTNHGITLVCMIE